MISDGKRGFSSDNCSGVHPAVMEALLRANVGHAASYGYDELTAAVERAFDELFGQKVHTFLVMNGTGANCALLAHLTPRYGAIVCTDCAHINTHETGAPERIVSAKLFAQPAPGGKLLPDQVAAMAERVGDEHWAQPSVLSLTQITEMGTVYTPAEVRALADAAHELGMTVAMDGARIACAAAALDVPVKEFTCNAGVDALVFGGAKNAMLCGEAIVFFDEAMAKNFKCTRKGAGQLISKMRFVAAQFLALLTDGLWLETARHANRMAKELSGALRGLGIDAPEPDANIVYADLDDGLGKALEAEYGVHKMGLWRFVTNFDTQKEDIEQLAGLVKELQ